MTDDEFEPIEPLATRVRRGYDFLTDKQPGWQEHIDCSILDLNSRSHCIIGQLYGDYWVALDRRVITPRLAVYYGFTADDLEDVYDGAYDDLTDEWRKLLCQPASNA